MVPELEVEGDAVSDQVAVEVQDDVSVTDGDNDSVSDDDGDSVDDSDGLAVRDALGEFTVHIAAPARLNCPDGHSTAVGDVDPAGHAYPF